LLTAATTIVATAVIHVDKIAVAILVHLAMIVVILAILAHAAHVVVSLVTSVHQSRQKLVRTMRLSFMT